jgi:hypothetical protein
MMIESKMYVIQDLYCALVNFDILHLKGAIFELDSHMFVNL